MIRKVAAKDYLPNVLTPAAAAEARVRYLHIDRADETPTKTVRDGKLSTIVSILVKITVKFQTY